MPRTFLNLNKQLTLSDDVVEATQEENRREAGRSLSCPQDIFVVVNIRCFILKEGKLGRNTNISFIGI